MSTQAMTQQIAEYFKTQPVLKAWLFGSFARGEQREDSDVDSFLQGKTFEEMKSDMMCFHAVVYNIMIIGEAANLLTKEFRKEHPEVPQRDIVDMRNVLAHGYFTTSAIFIWETYQ